MQEHPEIRKFMRRLTEEEFTRLEANILRDGIREPLAVWEHEGQQYILDGHNRYEIARRHGLGFQVRVIEGLESVEDAVGWVLRNQLGRRNLTPAEVSYYRGHEYLREKKPVGRPQKSSQNDQIPGVTSEKIAKKHKSSEKTVRRDAEFAKSLDAIAEIAGDSVRGVVLSKSAKLDKSDVVKLAAVARREPETASRLISRAVEVGKRALIEYSRSERVKTLARASELADSGIPLCHVIYADPPWEYDFSPTESRAIENQYPTLSLTEIKDLPVSKISAADAVCFLWATSPKLAEALEVLRAWGFEYRTCLVWVKDKMGMGHWFRQQHELLLLGTRGNIPVPLPEHRPSSVLHAPRGEHSAKPVEAIELIERMCAGLMKVELFARSRREGWFCWGNEVNRGESI